MRNVLAIAAISAAIIMSCATPGPGMQTAIDAGVKYVKGKAECEASGKDYKCGPALADCKCVERPAPPPAPPPAPEPVNPAPTPAPAPTPSPVAGGCVSAPAHSENGWWKMTECGPVGGNSDYTFDTAGWPAPRHGKLMFKAKGIDSGQMREDPAFVVIHAKLQAPNGNYSTFLFAMSKSETFMLAVRIDGSCDPREFCEQPDHEPGAIEWDPNVTYKFDCDWDESAKATCSVYDEAGKNLLTLSVPTWGPLPGYTYFAIGNQAEHNHPAAAIRTGVTLTGITLAVKE